MRKPHRLVAIVVAVVGLAGSTESILADCRDADPSRCTRDECQRRQNVATSLCGLQRFCVNVDQTHKATLRLFVSRNEACLAARQELLQCFTIPMQGLQQGIDEANDEVDACQTKLDQ